MIFHYQTHTVLNYVRPFFLRLGRLSPPSLLLHVVYRGVPKQLPSTKVPGIQLFEKSLQSYFSLPLGTRAFSQHPLPKNALPPSSVIDPRILFPFFLFVAVFSLLLNKCQLLMPKDFLEPPCLTLLGVSLVLWKGERGNR